MVWWMRREPMTRRQMLDTLKTLTEDVSPPRSIHETSDGRERLTEWQIRKLRSDAKRKRG